MTVNTLQTIAIVTQGLAVAVLLVLEIIRRTGRTTP
jgi:hypothetical protein